MAFCETCEYHSTKFSNLPEISQDQIKSFNLHQQLNDKFYLAEYQTIPIIVKYDISENLERELDNQGKASQYGLAPKIYGYWNCNETEKQGYSVIVDEYLGGYKLSDILSILPLHVFQILLFNIYSLNYFAHIFMSEIRLEDVMYIQNSGNEFFQFLNFSKSSQSGSDDIYKLCKKILMSNASSEIKEFIIQSELDSEFTIQNIVKSLTVLGNVPTFDKILERLKNSLTDDQVKDCYDSDILSEKCQSIDKKLKNILVQTFGKAESAGKPPKDYQKLAVQHLLNHDGLIVGFQVGTGKTLTATMAIYAINQLGKLLGKDIKVYIVTPASLVDNMRNEMARYGIDIKDTNKYKFMTLAKFGNMFKAGEIDCTDSFLVIDEAHNIRTDYRAEFALYDGAVEKNNTRAEYAIECGSVAWKSLLLTATPIYNAPHDMVNLQAIVKKMEIPYTKYEWDAILEDDDLFRKEFECTTIFQASNPEDFPKRIDKYVRIEMSDEYYWRYRDIEQRALRQLPKGSYQEEVSNSFYIGLKKASNDLSPCLKCDYIMKNILNKREKTVIYSSLKSSGIELIQSRLNPDDYITITGDVSTKKRQGLVDAFNSPGGPFVFFITKAGGEGLDLKGVRHVVILEQGWNEATNEQAIGRGIRYRSHHHLPPDQRNTTVYYLIITKPKEVVTRLEKLYGNNKISRYQEPLTTGDEYFYNITQTKEIENKKLLSRFEETDLKHRKCNSPHL